MSADDATLHMTSRREFVVAAGAFAALGRAGAGEGLNPVTAGIPGGPRGIRVRFLGSGAAGWQPEWKATPHMRRQSSVLIEGRVLIDFTECSFDMLPEGCRPEVLFQTHSHGDHYNPPAAVKSGVKRMYVQETWASAARREVAGAARKLGLPAPEVVSLPFGMPVDECGMRFTGVPANHSTSRVTDGVLERTSLYLVEKGPTRLLYATDTGGLMGDAARMIGIDPHIDMNNYGRFAGSGSYVAEPKAITALIMEATNADLDDDFRQFVHSSVQDVQRTVTMLKRHRRFVPPDGQSAYITHLGLKYRDWPPEKIDAELPDGLRSASDGLEVVLG